MNPKQYSIMDMMIFSKQRKESRTVKTLQKINKLVNWQALVESKNKRKELEQKPSSQVDTNARSTEKGGKKYFGFKGHIGVDVENLIG